MAKRKTVEAQNPVATPTPSGIIAAFAQAQDERSRFLAVMGEGSSLISAADAAIRGEIGAHDSVRGAMFALVQGLRDLGVKAGDAGVLKVLQDVLSEHIGNLGAESPVGKKWAQWVRPIKQAVYHGIPESEFGLGLRNQGDKYPLPGKNGKVGASGKVKSTDLLAVFKTASKLLEQLRLLGYSTQSAELVDWMAGHWPEFKEVGEDGKPIA